MFTLSLTDGSNLNFYSYIKSNSFCETFLYTQKEKKQSCLRAGIKKRPNTESSLEQ